MPTLADLYSAIGTARRKASDFVQNPMGSLGQMVGNANDRARALNQMTAEAAQEQDLYGPASRALGQKLADAYNPIGMTVYHGSPHLFERFDLGKIGTGEGSQAYGRGLYMAQNPEVAEGYRKALSKNVTVDGSKLQTIPSDSPLAEAHNMTVRNIQNGMKPDEAIAATQKYWTDAANEMQGYAKENPQLVDRINQEVQSRMKVSSAAKTLKPESFYLDPGSFYKVDLPDTHIRRMLDWDEPLKNQPKQVRELAKKLGMDMNDLGGDLVGKVGKGEEGKQILEKAGIRGIKYFDQMSRGDQTGTRNFVVFDPNHLTILERNNEKIK